MSIHEGATPHVEEDPADSAVAVPQSRKFSEPLTGTIDGIIFIYWTRTRKGRYRNVFSHISVRGCESGVTRVGPWINYSRICFEKKLNFYWNELRFHGRNGRTAGEGGGAGGRRENHAAVPLPTRGGLELRLRCENARGRIHWFVAPVRSKYNAT